MNDRELEQRLRRTMPSAEPPPFDLAWQAAEARHQRVRRRNAALAGVAATLAVLALVMTAWPTADEDLAYIELAELLESTSWQAPSDVLLPAHEFDIYQELPVLMESTDEAGGALL